MQFPIALPELQAKRLVLRPFGAADITPAYIGWLNDVRVTRFSNQRFRKHDAASSQAYLTTFINSDNLFVSIRGRTDDNAIGTMTAYINRHHQTADIGLLIGDPASWGQGYGQEAWDTLCDWLLRMGIRKLTAGAAAGNVAMLLIMERSGMQHEATRRGQELIEGAPHDLLYYAKFNDKNR